MSFSLIEFSMNFWLKFPENGPKKLLRKLNLDAKIFEKMPSKFSSSDIFSSINKFQSISRQTKKIIERKKYSAINKY
jgi:hypothetical protein